MKFTLEYTGSAKYLLDMPGTMETAVTRFERGDVVTVRHPGGGEIDLEVEAVRYFIDLPSGGLVGSPYEALVTEGVLTLQDNS